MQRAGTLDTAAYAKLPKVSGKPILLTTDQTKKAAGVLSKQWAKVTG
jgi:putative spermidine/putrescine transport system substrate-binding protein